MTLYFLSVVFLLPAGVFSSYNLAERDELKLITEKETILNAVYEDYIQRTLKELQYEAIPSHKTIELQPVENEKEFFAALHERYTAITLNIICWTCSIYYAEGVVGGNEESTAKATKCAEVAKVLDWYNSHFTVSVTDVFYTAMINKGEKIEANFDDFINNISAVWARLNSMNEIFEESNLNYKNVFGKLRTLGANLAKKDTTEIQQKDEEFVKILWFRFAVVLDARTWAKMDTYIWKFLNGKETNNMASRLQPNFDELSTMFKIIQETPKIEAQYSDLMKILDLERRFLQSRLIANDIAIPDSAASRTWVVKQNRGEYAVDKRFEFEETIAD